MYVVAMIGKAIERCEDRRRILQPAIGLEDEYILSVSFKREEPLVLFALPIFHLVSECCCRCANDEHTR